MLSKRKIKARKPIKQIDAFNRKVFICECGKFLIDIAKLVFAGVVLGAIMGVDDNRWITISVGLFAMILTFLLGGAMVSLTKEDKE